MLLRTAASTALLASGAIALAAINTPSSFSDIFALAAAASSSRGGMRFLLHAHLYPLLALGALVAALTAVLFCTRRPPQIEDTASRSAQSSRAAGRRAGAVSPLSTVCEEESSTDAAAVADKSADSATAKRTAPSEAAAPASLATFDAPAITAASAASDNDRFDAIVVGGGVVGCAMACALGKQGRRVLLLERDLTEPDRIVGELLQPDGVAKLAELGLAHCLEDIDSPHVYGYSLYFQGEQCCVSYPSEAPADNADAGSGNSSSARDRQFAPIGRGFHHGRFVTRLRRAVAALPTVTVRQGAVQALLYRDESLKGTDAALAIGARYEHAPAVHAATIGALHPAAPLAFRTHREGEGEAEAQAEADSLDRTEVSARAYAPLTIVVDGCFSKFRKELSLPELKPQTNSSFLGLMLYDCEMPYANHGLVCLTDPTPAVIYPIATNEIRALISFPNRVPPREELKEYLSETLLPQLPECMRPALLRAVDAGHFRSMPNQFMSARPRLVRGAALIGDSLNMRHPFTGGGMTCGFSDVVRLRDRLACIAPGAEWDATDAAVRELKPFYAQRQHNATINMLSVALFEVCSANAPELRQACFDYLSRGPAYFEGPIALLSGRARSQALLARHFASVALFGIGRALLPCPTPRRLWTALKMLRQAVSIFAPLAESERAAAPLVALCRVMKFLLMC